MGLICGLHDAKLEGFTPAAPVSTIACVPMAPTLASYEKGVAADLAPQYIKDTLAFMFESRFVFRPTALALSAGHRQRNYDDCWKELPRGFTG